MKMESLRELYIEELKDLYSAENRRRTMRVVRDWQKFKAERISPHDAAAKS